MRYYSDVTRKYYESEKACLEAEEAAQKEEAARKEAEAKAVEDRKAAAKKVEDAYAAMLTAQKEYTKLRREFINKYGAFHMTFCSDNSDSFDWIDQFFRIF